MKSLFNKCLAAGLAVFLSQAAMSQTLELVTNNGPVGSGVSVANITATYKADATNPTGTNTFDPTYSGGLTATFSFSKQQYTGFNYGSAANANVQSTGLVFGAAPTLAASAIADGATQNNRWTGITSYEGAAAYAPTANMFTTDPFNNPGVGIQTTGSGNSINAGAKVFTTAQVLFGSGVSQNSRVYFGNLVITFNRPVKNPVISLAGLGGSYQYTTLGGSVGNCADYRSIFFTTELELANSGLTSTLLSGNTLFTLTGNNISNANHANPNGGSTVVAGGGCTDQYGAASGSIRINGTVQTVVYRVYLQGGTSSNAPTAWSVGAGVIDPGVGNPALTHGPFTGDIWSVTASLQRPVAEISGHVYNDADGQKDPGGADVNKSAGVKNDGTNAGGLFANLFSTAGTLVGSVAVGADGSYIFDSLVVAGNKVPLPAGSYTVKISTNTGAIGSNPANALPANWYNTNAFIGAGPGTGSITGTSALVVFDGLTNYDEVNFGIERAPESENHTYNLNPKPAFNSKYTLNGIYSPLTGSDPEDMVTTASLIGKNVRIDVLPTNSTLLYNNVAVTAGQVITGYDPTKLQVWFNMATVVENTEFQYSYIDAAGIADPSPATYRLIWSGFLAVDMTEFTATKIDCSANLHWVTETEVNIQKYEIQVSTGGDFKPAGYVAAAGNSNTRQEYGYKIAMAPGVVYQFRINTIEADGTSHLSIIKKLSCDGKGGILIAPNPVVDQFRISGMSAGKNTVAVFNADGKLVKTEIVSGSTGIINIVNAAPGTYVVRVVDENMNVFTDRIIKK